MPRLLLFAPCDNVLVSRHTESVSLIVLFTEIKFVPPPAGTSLPEGTAAPMRWFIFSQWEILPDDIGVTFEQSVKMLNETGKQLFELEQEFRGEDGKPIHRVVIGVPGFPVTGGEGRFSLVISLRKKGENAWEEKGSYPLKVVHSAEPIAVII
jgi:hypothetical protein